MMEIPYTKCHRRVLYTRTLDSIGGAICMVEYGYRKEHPAYV